MRHCAVRGTDHLSGVASTVLQTDRTIRSIAATERSTSSSIVAHELTLSRIAVCPLHTVVGPHQQSRRPGRPHAATSFPFASRTDLPHQARNDDAMTLH